MFTDSPFFVLAGLTLDTLELAPAESDTIVGVVLRPIAFGVFLVGGPSWFCNGMIFAFFVLGALMFTTESHTDLRS